jgi:hypothetical protein
MNGVYSLAFDSTSRVLASGGGDKLVKLWDFNSLINNFSVSTSTSPISDTTLSSINTSSPSSYCLLNPNYVPKSGLTHYWTFNNNLTDTVSGVTLYNGSNACFAPNRFNDSNVALSLSNGYYQVPSGVYFNSSYTVMAWVYVRAYNSWSRLIDFGIGNNNNNIIIALSSGVSGNPNQQFYINQNRTLMMDTLQILSLNTWKHLAFTFSSKNLTGFFLCEI